MVLIRLKKAVEVPGQIQSVIDKIIASPIDGIASVLQGFSWTFDKVSNDCAFFCAGCFSSVIFEPYVLQGDFSQWTALFNHFDVFLEKLTKPRKELQLNFEEGGEAAPPFPVEDCLAVLRTSCVLLENSGNKHFYASYEVRAGRKDRQNICVQW